MATVVATRELGCLGVLCGMPMDERPHFHGGRGRRAWTDADFHWDVWLRFRHLLGRARSMSGRTRELLGAPTAEELLGAAA